MERDFMGLTSKQPLSVVKEEIHDDSSKDSGLSKGCSAQWLFSNKVSALPHLMSFKVSHDSFDSTHKSTAPEPKKSYNPDGQGGFHFSLTPYPIKHDVNSGNHPHDVKMFSVSNQAVSVPTGSPFLKNHFASAGQHLNGAHGTLPSLGGMAVTAPPSAGMPESCVKPSAPPAQLTIFYGGIVNVFEDISSEKAQAIMLLAGTGLSCSSNMAQPRVQAPGLKLAAVDGVPVTQPANTPPCSGLPSPLSVSSHAGAQSGSGSTSTDEFLANKTTAVLATPASNVEPPKVVIATTMLTSAVPQARKASLARFLEKRKERVMCAAPYNHNKKSEECATAEYNGAYFSATNSLSVERG